MALFSAASSSPVLCQDEITISPLAEIELQGDDQVISIPLDKVETIEVSRNISDVIIGNPDIADVIVKTQNRAYIIGRSTGDTDILFVDPEGNVISHIVVRVELDLAAASAAIAKVIDASQIELTALNNNIMLQGVVHTAKESADAAKIASNFVDADGNTTVVNMLQVIGDQQVLSKPTILAGRCRGQAGRPPPLFPNFSFSYGSTSTKIQISPFADSLANLTIDPIPSTEPDFEDLFLPITGDSIP